MPSSFPRKINGWGSDVSLYREKSEACGSATPQHIRTCSIAAVPLENLIGKLVFAHPSLFGKFARNQLRPLYRKLYSDQYTQPFLRKGYVSLTGGLSS